MQAGETSILILSRLSILGNNHDCHMGGVSIESEGRANATSVKLFAMCCFNHVESIAHLDAIVYS